MKFLNKIDKHTIRLSLSYLAIIMLLSVSFSVVFYRTSTHELERQVPPHSFYDRGLGGPDSVGIDQFFHSRIDEARHALLGRLVLLNILALIVGAGLSYYLARRTLKPIEEAMDAQVRFSSDASHELRTPLTAIRTKNEVALRKPSLNAAEAKEVIESNLAEIMKLEKLSDGLLKLAKENGKSLVKVPVELDSIVAHAMNQVIEPAQAKEISINDSVPKIKVLGDLDSLAQAVVILLDNAIKYSPNSSTIYIEGKKKGKHAYLAIRDEGSGMRASDLPHIFERFYRADHSRTKHGGNGYGLGLSIAKKIIEQHHGEIMVESTLDKGSTFTIKLPLAES